MDRISVISTNKKGFTFVELQASIIFVGIFLALFIPAVERSRESARRSQCRNNLKRIGLAVRNYENKFNIFPPAMILGSSNQIAGGCEKKDERTGGFSWRALILPDVEQDKLYSQIDFDGTAGILKCSGANGPPGAKWTNALKTKIETYFCPSNEVPANIDNGWTGSNYAAMISIKPNYKFSNLVNPILSGPQEIGVLHPEDPARIKELSRDGESSTIMIMEVDRGLKLIQRENNKESFRCGRWFNSQGCYVDGCRTPDDFGSEREPFRDETSLDKALVFDNFVSNKTKGWGRAASSTHGKIYGAHLVRADGSVSWLNSFVNLDLYQATCTRNGGETETIEF